MPFITPVLLQAPIKEGDLWITQAPLGYKSKRFTYEDGRPKIYIVPAFYATNLASVPRLPLVYWLVGGRGAAAAVIHDFLYDNGMRLKLIDSRQEADDLYLEILMDMGVSGVLAEGMHWGVVTFGESRFTG
jgi:hypothetical protein